MLKNHNQQILITTLLLMAVIILFEWSNWDIVLQEYFYDFQSKSWLLDKNEPILKFILYSGLKKLLIAFAITILFVLLFFRKYEAVKEYKKGLWTVVLSAIFVPLFIASLKYISNTPCPCDIEHFNGNYPNVKVFDGYPSSFKQESKIKCWPAGHASAGFALLAFYFVFKDKVNKKRSLYGALLIGWSMGIYKMLIGHHFLSHTIITIIIAWLIILIIVKSQHKIEKAFL